MIYLKASGMDKKIEKRLQTWKTERTIERIFKKDPSVWISDKPDDNPAAAEISNRLGWVDATEKIRPSINQLQSFCEDQKIKGIKDVILLGMGGSSLAPEVIMDVFGNKDGWPALTVLDTTNPETILSLMPMLDPETTLFIVSSKSGGTIETLSLFKYFYSFYQSVGLKAGDHFIAVTDPGSGLEHLAGKDEKGFLRTFSSPPDVGGRYSALTVFGMLPAAIIGVEIGKVIDRAEEWMNLSRDIQEIEKNPAALLGAFMGEAAIAGKDKLTILLSPSISRLGAWIEQLVAESLGKDGKGILPLVDEMPFEPGELSDDRVYVFIKVQDETDESTDVLFEQLSSKNLPVVKLIIKDKYDLGGLFFIWELATALSASILGINPFDQPNVESAKIAARDLMEGYKKTRKLNVDNPIVSNREIDIYCNKSFGAKDTMHFISSYLKELQDNGYIAIMAYLPYDEEINELLEDIRTLFRNKTHSAVTLGYGPRFLHSTGQLHKGDGNKGLFIQITHRITEDIDIPGEPYSFGTLITAQAIGDYTALKNADRRVCRLHLKGDISENLESILKAL